MRKNNFFKLFAFFTLALSFAFGVTSCGDDDNGGDEFNENDYVGTYVGAHVISEPTLVNIIKQIDSTQDGSFADTIIVTTGSSSTDNILEFTSLLLNGATIQADISKTGNNVTEKNFGTLVLGETTPVTIENARVKATSRITASGGNRFQANLKLAGTLKSGSITFPISDLATTGTFTKQ